MSRVLSEPSAVHKPLMYQVNHRAVLVMHITDKGCKALFLLAAFLDMPLPIAECSFDKRRKQVRQAALESGNKSMQHAAVAVPFERADQPQHRGVAVSTDGAWL